ncbi:phage replication protein [Pseudomonas brenneri]
MQYTVTINQAKALEWGLNAQQALLFAFVYECPSWANKVKTDGGEFFALSKAKIVEELPLLTDKPDTAYRLLIALRDAGLIDLSSTSNITLIRLTVKAKEWNRKLDGSEKYPTLDKAEGRKKIRGRSEKNPSKVGEKSDQGRKKIRRGSEKSPTNQVTSNQVTNQVTSNQDLPEGSDKPNQPGALVLVVDQASGPRVEIPADMPGPKDQTCKTFKAWANYAMAYRKRYQCWPVWNAAAGGMLGKLVDLLGADVAHSVAAYYLTINDARLINDYHSLKTLIAKAGAYHTQWMTGRQMNSRTARQIEDTQANLNAAQEATRNILEGGKRNAFL